MNPESRTVTAYTEDESQQAAEWFLIIHDSQDPSAETLQEWGRWLGASASHRAAFAAVEEAYHLAAPDLAASLAQEQTAKCDDDYDASLSVAQWLAKRRAHSTWRRYAPSLAVAAGLAAIAVSWMVFKADGPVPAASKDIFATRTAEHLDLRLPDGSRVTLGARSSLAVDFDAANRSIRLDRGEAFFSVRKDPNRPFVVHALDGAITAVGTAFNVRATEDQVTVTVAEGMVRVMQRRTAQSPSRPLSLGEQISFKSGAAEPAGAAITHFDAEEAASWRAGWLIYRNEPLRYVIADVARYSDLQIDGGDAVAGELRFSGAVFKDNVEEWLMALPRVFPIAIDAQGSRMTITSTAER